MTPTDFIHFNDIVRHERPVSFALMIKPVGSACNLNCQYCYYIEKAKLYDNNEPVMSKTLLEKIIIQHIEANDRQEMSFVWHGGEPLLAGIDFYRRACNLQKKHANGKTIYNSLQTNGLLINEEWCDFFNNNNYLLGISIDGPEDIHNCYRTNKAGHPNFRKLLKNIELLNRKQVAYNTLSVVSKQSEGRGVETYNFLKSIGSRFMQFMPAYDIITNNSTETLAPWSVNPIKYGEFLNDIFDLWVTQDVGKYYVTLFDAILAGWCNIAPGTCIFSDNCGDSLTVEHNGDVYSCDHFVSGKYFLDNISNKSLRDIYMSNKHFDFILNKRYSLPRECLSCDYYKLCIGECPKHRFGFDSGKVVRDTKNALCEGLKLFFAHTKPAMLNMQQLLEAQRPPADIML